MTYTIQYDLPKPGQNYTQLSHAIKQLGTWSKPLESCFAVVTSMTVRQIRDFLTPYLDSNDKLLVTQVGPDWASRNLTDEDVLWFKQHVG